MDLATIGSLAYCVAVLVELTKPLLDYIISPKSPLQNTSVRLYVFIVAAVTVTLDAFLTYHLNTRTDVRVLLSETLAVAGAAITGYHLLTSNDLPTPPTK